MIIAVTNGIPFSAAPATSIPTLQTITSIHQNETKPKSHN
jgi:hypothetical protein